MPSFRVEPLPGYTPAVGRLVAMMTYSREVLLRDVKGLSVADLDHLHDSMSNTIGALLAHGAAVEWVYQVLTFEGREPTEEEVGPRLAALNLGDAGRSQIRGRDLESYLDTLAGVRAETLAQLALRNDEWLEAPMSTEPDMNPHWAWFHVTEDEVNHRGQIRWLRARLP